MCYIELGIKLLCYVHLDAHRSPYMDVNEARCGNWSDLAPNHSVLVANNLAISLPCLLFGLLFAISAMKAVVRSAKVMASNIASTAMSSSVGGKNESSFSSSSTAANRSPYSSQGKVGQST